MELAKRVKISFCTTCKNRLWQIAQTMPKNLAAIETDGCAEMVLVNYNSQDGLDVWIRQFGSAIEGGTLRYVHERSERNFHASKAKNLAHLAATGEFVVNLDADNFIGNTIARYRKVWAVAPDTVIHGFCRDMLDGTYGRIGMAKRHFLALGGYDEEMLPMGSQDLDLLRRAEAYALRFTRLPQRGTPAIRNDFVEKVRYSGMDLPYVVMNRMNRSRADESLRMRRLVANPGRKPRAVLINFGMELAI